MNFLDRLKQLTTVRSFQATAVAPELVRSLLEAARRAPSQFNLQPWRVVVVGRPALRKQLAACCLDQSQIIASPVAFIIGAQTVLTDDEVARAVDSAIAAGRWPPEDRSEKTRFIRACYEQVDFASESVKQAMLFGHQLLLAATSAGLGGYWLGGLDDQAVRKTFGIPEAIAIAGVVGIGWPQDDPKGQDRLPLEAFVRWNRWASPPGDR